jgi:outer membrane protein assembly factor BamA
MPPIKKQSRFGWFLLFLGLIFFSFPAQAWILAAPVEPESSYAQPDTSTLLDKALNVKIAAWGWVYLPVFYYHEERGIGVGGEIVHDSPWLNDKLSIDASDIKFEGQFTTKKQGRVQTTTNLRWGDGTYYFRTRLSFTNLKLHYYGIGPNTPSSNSEVFQPQSLRAYVEFYRRLYKNLKLGLRYEFENFLLLEYEANGLLDDPSILSSTDKATLGAGLLFQWDARNRKYSPTSGFYYQGFSLLFDDEFGSLVTFNNFHADLRNYFTLSGKHILATQVFLYGARGAPPVWRLAEMGGRAHSRGYRRGRYRDNILLAFQGEYRFPLWNRFEMVAFGGASAVTPSFGSMKSDFFKPNYGTGLRFRLKSEDGIRARFDVAGGGEDIRFYLSLDEAF